MQTLLAVTGAKPTACAARLAQIPGFSANSLHELFNS
jgi:hypothetical protein